MAGLCAGVVEAMGQQNPSHRFGPDQCGPADPSYIRTANETGGVPLFLQRSEAVKAMQLMRESTRENVSTVLWASAKLGGTAQEFDVPVDSVTERITFTFSVDTKGSRLVMRQPNGQEVVAGSARTEDTELNCGRLITVEKPQVGNWHAELTGSGTYWLQAQSQSDINFITAEFVELRGRPGHQGLFKIAGQPIAGSAATLRTELSGDDAKSAEFVLVSERGDVLEKLAMKPSDNDPLEFFGDLKLPGVPFRIAVVGTDTAGLRYQRFYAPLFHAETVQVTPKLDFDEIAVGGDTREAVFAVKNLGPARSFRITVTDARRFVTNFEPRELPLDADGSGLVRVQLSVPVGISNVFEDDLVIVAASNSGPATTNSAVVRLRVADTKSQNVR